MRPAAIVVGTPRFEHLSDMTFAKRNHEVETLPTSTADQALAKGICLGRFVWSLQHSQAKRLQRLVQVLGIDTVSVMDGEPVSFIAGHAFSKLLQGPFGSRMSSDVKVKDSPRLEFHDHENINEPERCGHNDKRSPSR